MSKPAIVFPKINHLNKPMEINEPMVLISADDYHELLVEAGYLPTPKLKRDIARARKNFCSEKTIKWEALKNELK